MILTLNDDYGDPVIVNWDNVTFAEEIRVIQHPASTERKFQCTRLWFVKGEKSYLSVRQNMPTIEAQLRELG